MNTADLLRKEVVNKLPFTKKELIDKVVDCIRRNGYYAYYWGRNTSLRGNEFNSESIHIVHDWIREEGFRIEQERSVYGIPNYYASL